MTITLTAPSTIAPLDYCPATERPARPRTRAERIASGALVDVTAEARRLGFRHPVALTRAAWEDSVRWDETIEARKYGHTEEEAEGRLRDLLWNALVAARRSSRSAATFYLNRVPVTGRGTQCQQVALVVAISGGDRREPVITVSLPGESAT